MRAEGPFRFELTGAPELRLEVSRVKGTVRAVVSDLADNFTFNDVSFVVDSQHADRLDRAVAAFNAEMLREATPVKDAAE